MVKDVVVIGGGAIGSALTYFLAKEGHKVTLVEKNDIADGSSSRCDGHAVVYDSLPGYFSQLSKKAIDMFPETIKDLKQDIHFEMEGIGLLLETKEHIKVAKEIYEGKVAEGIPAEFWDQNELQKREPHIAKDILGAINYQCDSRLDPMRLCYALIERAKEYGAEIKTFTEVKDISISSSKPSAVVTDKGVIYTKNIVNCAGTWANEIGKMVGMDIPVVPRQGQVLVTERTFKLASQSYVEFGYLATKYGQERVGITKEMEDAGVAFVLEPTADGNFLVGSSRAFVGFDTNNYIETIKAMAKRATRFFPAMEDINIIRTYSGLRPSTPDNKPIVSSTNIPGFYVATGHEGNGISLSLLTGKLMTELISGVDPSIDISPLSIERFY